MVMHLLRCLWFFQALFDISVHVSHIPGVHNCVADMLSRNQVPKFLQLYPQSSPAPPSIPPLLIQIVSPRQLECCSKPTRESICLFLAFLLPSHVATWGRICCNLSGKDGPPCSLYPTEYLKTWETWMVLPLFREPVGHPGADIPPGWPGDSESTKGHLVGPALESHLGGAFKLVTLPCAPVSKKVALPVRWTA